MTSWHEGTCRGGSIISYEVKVVGHTSGMFEDWHTDLATRLSCSANSPKDDGFITRLQEASL